MPLVLAAGLAISAALPAAGGTPDSEPGPLELANAALSRTAATEGMVLLQNQDGALPMPGSGPVAVFGVGAYKTVKGGTGSGDVNNRYTVTVRQGLEKAGYTVTTSPAYWSAMTSAYDAKYGTGPAPLFGPPIDYSSVEQQLTGATVRPTAPTDTALFVVARNAGEGADRTSGPGDYLLTDTERGDLALLGRTYRHVVVVLNVGGVMDTGFFQQLNAGAHDPAGGPALDSLLLMSQPGQEAGNALVDVLNGTVNPSGHLTDTWAAKYSYYPASSTFGANDGNTDTEPYGEGIYVGYRYFDSFYGKIDPADPAGVVDYPFGYGLSYTTFAVKTQAVHAGAHAVTVRVKVTNTGRRGGQQVVQVYFSAPASGVDKPYQELAGYAKTDELAPGRSQTLTIGFDTKQMASYDARRSAYVLDAGTYAIRVGDSSRSTHVAARVELRRSVVTELVNHEMDGSSAPDLRSDPKNFFTYPGEKRELATAPRRRLDARAFRTQDERSPYEQDVPVPSSSPYYAIDGSPISSTTAYVDPKQSDWEGTGVPYTPKSGEHVRAVTPRPGATLYDVAKGTVSLKEFVAGLNVTQLANLVEGLGFSPAPGALGSTPTAVGAAGYTTAKYESLGVPSMTLSDGPAGLRLTQKIPTTPPTYQWATAWPIGTMLAQTWDRDLVRQVGDAIGKEMREYGVTLWLAPGMNIHRDPLNGRNFEYYSEDPLIAGLTAAATTAGIQSNPGVGVTLKHFAENSQEANRNADNAVVSERALREIELKAFEYAVKSAQPMAIMSSYNKVNGTWASKNYDLLTDVLRGEWGFQGLVMTDWGGAHGAVDTMYSGNDLIEPGGNPDEVIAATKKVLPSIDVTGMPAYDKTTISFGTFTFTSYSTAVGSFALSATGGQSITTTVDQHTDLTKVPLSGTTTTDASGASIFTPNAPYGSVDAAYKDATALLKSGAFDAGQKAAIAITDVVHATPGDDTSPVTAYTVTLKGAYRVDMRLGDLQRSVTHILTVAMQSEPFAQLAAQHGVVGIHVGPYTARFGDLPQFLTVERSPVRGHR